MMNKNCENYVKICITYIIQEKVHWPCDNQDQHHNHGHESKEGNDGGRHKPPDIVVVPKRPCETQV